MHDRKLNGCRQRLLFARQLIPRKCSLCSQGNKQSIEYGKKALNIARYVLNREREIDALVVLSRSYYEVGDYHDLSVECGKRALSIAKEVGNRKRSISVRCFGQVLSARRRIKTEY